MGLFVGALCLPRCVSRVRRIATLAAFAMVSLIPDVPIAGWGHDRYDISHSIFVACGVFITTTVLLVGRRRLRDWLGGWRFPAAAAACWVSHLLLDCLYNHGRGLAMLWPFSSARLNLALPWSANLHRDGGPSTARICLIEALVYGALLAVCISVRRRRTHRDVPSQRP